MLRGGQSLNFAVPVEVIMPMLRLAQEGDRGLRTLVPLAALSKRDASNAAATQANSELAVLASPEYKAAESARLDALAAAGLSSLLGKITDPEVLRKIRRKEADWEKALDTAKAVVAKYPESGIAYAQLGNVHEMMGFTDQAIEAYQRAVELNPDSSSAWESLGRIYKEKGKFSQADFAFSQAIAYQTKRVQRRGPGSFDFSLSTLGNIYREAGNIDAAKQTYLRDVQENPKSSILSLHGLMDIYLSESNEKAAFAVAYQIILLNPTHKIPEAEAWDFLAGWYYQHSRESDGYRCSVNARDLGLQR